jgi:hypothetical protein
MVDDTPRLVVGVTSVDEVTAVSAVVSLEAGTESEVPGAAAGPEGLAVGRIPSQAMPATAGSTAAAT